MENHNKTKVEKITELRDKVLRRYLTRGRNWFRKEVKPSWQLRADKLPDYATQSYYVVSDPLIRQAYDLFVFLLLSIGIFNLILNGQALDREIGTVHIKTDARGWVQTSKDNSQRSRSNSHILDTYDLRWPLVENSAIFIAFKIHQSPMQVRYVPNKMYMPVVCDGMDLQSESCITDDDCRPIRGTRNGFLLPGFAECNQISGFCTINSWCNLYHWVCQTDGKSYHSQETCEFKCPMCNKDSPLFHHKIFRSENQNSSEIIHQINPSCRGLQKMEYDVNVNNNINNIDKNNLNKYTKQQQSGSPVKSYFKPKNTLSMYSLICMDYFVNLDKSIHDIQLRFPFKKYQSEDIKRELINYNQINQSMMIEDYKQYQCDIITNSKTEIIKPKISEALEIHPFLHTNEKTPLINEPNKRYHRYWIEKEKCTHIKHRNVTKEVIHRYMSDMNHTTTLINNKHQKTNKVEIVKLPFLCFNPYRRSKNAREQRCQQRWYSANSTLATHSEYLKTIHVDRILDKWRLSLDIILRFPRFWSVRSISDFSYPGVNYFDLRKITEDLSIDHSALTDTGAVIQGTLLFRCPFFSRRCNSRVSWMRVDREFPGFESTRVIFQPSQKSQLGSALKTGELRFVEKMRGLRILLFCDAVMTAPNPLSVIIALGTLTGLLSVAKFLTDQIIVRRMDKSQFVRVSYEDWVKQEKEQIERCFEEAIFEEMECLYKREIENQKREDGAEGGESEVESWYDSTFEERRPLLTTEQQSESSEDTEQKYLDEGW